MAVTKTIEVKGMDDVYKFIKPRAYENAMTDALKAMASQCRELSREAVEGAYNVKKPVIRQSIKSTRKKWEIKVTVKSNRVDFSKLIGTTKVAAGVSAKVKNASGADIIEHSFWVKFKSGHQGAYFRTKKPGKIIRGPKHAKGAGAGGGLKCKGRHGLRITELTTLTVPDMFNQEESTKAIQDYVDNEFEAEFHRQFEKHVGR